MDPYVFSNIWIQFYGNHKSAKRNFPSCSLRSQFTASQKLPLLFPNAKHMEPATGTIKSHKETSPLAHFARNSLPHKSFRFCSPMLNKWKPRSGNHMVAKGNFPSCSPRSQFTASQKLPLLFPNAKHMEPATGTIKSQKETSPLAHFARNSLPHKSFRFCSPMLNKWIPKYGYSTSYVWLAIEKALASLF